jgi:SufE protein probably involved in Fe-S center assembly
MTKDALTSFFEIKETLELLTSWEERYGYIMELGQMLPPLPDDLRRDEFKVRGCASQVWLVPQLASDKLSWLADSDALIVKGLTHMLLSFLAAQNLDDINEAKIRESFGALGLDAHLSAQRANGFSAMISRVEQDIRTHRTSA